jgi:hypothetical protein
MVLLIVAGAAAANGDLRLVDAARNRDQQAIRTLLNQVRNVWLITPDANRKDPWFDDNLRTAFVKETELFLDSQLREDRSVVELLTANYTFLNEQLARHDGIPKHQRLSKGRGPIDDRTVREEAGRVDGRVPTGKLLMYAVGRQLEYYDAPAIRGIMRAAAPMITAGRR